MAAESAAHVDSSCS